MGIRAITQDLSAVQVLRRAKQALQASDANSPSPRILWRLTGDASIDHIVQTAATEVVRGRWGRAQFRNAVVGALNDQIQALVAKYPTLDTND